jgi:hypothetical protein
MLLSAQTALVKMSDSWFFDTWFVEIHQTPILPAKKRYDKPRDTFGTLEEEQKSETNSRNSILLGGLM